MNKLHFGVVVGINRYPDIRHLKFARGDAERFADWLLDPQGGGLPPPGHADALLPEGHVATIVVDDAKIPDGTPRDQAIPVRKDVFTALYKFRKAAEAYIDEHPEDWERTRIYFYVSGHGIAPDARDAALLLADAGPDWYGENISCNQLLSFLSKNQPFHEVVIFADCCRERVAGAPLGGVPWTLNEKDNGHVLAVLGCATYFGDLAYEPPLTEADDPDQLRGYFTRALLEGLRGEAADPPGHGEVNSNSLARYVRQRVQDLTRHKKYPQRPTMEADPAEPVVFRAASAPPSSTTAPPLTTGHEVRIEFVTPFQGVVALRDGNDQIIGRHDTAGGDWVVKLVNGLYAVTPENGAAVALRSDGLFRVWGEGRHVQL
jgi:uncharacterized caspase-like protein